MPRLIEVAPERLDRWVARFGERHDGVTVSSTPGGLQAVAGDGSTASWERFDHDPLALLLIRRGGYAVGVAAGGRLVSHKTGTRYVQSRTAAGGWSQQRFARRRGNQAEELVRAVVDHAVRVVLDREVRPEAIVLGGDRGLAERLLADPRLAALADLPRRELFDLPDPRLDVLEKAVARGRAVRVTLSETAPGKTAPGGSTAGETGTAAG